MKFTSARQVIIAISLMALASFDIQPATAQVLDERNSVVSLHSFGRRHTGHFVTRDRLDHIVEDRTLGVWLLWADPIHGAAFPSSSLPTAPPFATHALDVDNDGWTDLVNVASSGLQIHRGLGGAQFEPIPSTLDPAGTPTSQFVAADFNGDGLRDFLLLKYDRGPSLAPAGELWIQSHGMTFIRWFREDQRGVQVDPAFADFDGDGKADIVTRVGGTAAGVLAILPGTSQQIFAPRLFGTDVLEFDPVLLVGQFSADPYQDLLVMGRTGGDTRSVHAFLGDPVHGLMHAWSGRMEFGLTPQGLTVGDADGDGLDDLLFRVFPPGLTPRTNVKRGLGGGMFSGPNATVFIEPGNGVQEWADFDQDGDLDLLRRNAVNPVNPGLYLFENRARYGTACLGALGVPIIAFGVPERGDPAFAITLSNALPAAPAQLVISAAAAGSLAYGAPCDFLVDFGSIAFPEPTGWFATSTDANGAAALSFPLPSFSAGPFFMQWAIIDPLGARLIAPGVSISMTAGRSLRIY